MPGIRLKRMQEILDELERDKEYTQLDVLKIAQTITGFRREICIIYIQDMQNMDLLFMGKDSRFLRKK